MYREIGFLSLLLSLVLAVGFAGTALADLEAHWPFDEGSGTIANDLSGNGNDGTLNGGAAWVAGQIGGAIEFNGSDARVVAPHIPLNNQSFTVTMWVNPVLYTGEQVVFSQTETSTTNLDLHFRLGGPGIGAGNVPAGGVRMGFYSNDLDTAGDLIQDNNWYHITFWYDFDNQDRRIYIDGEQAAQATATPYLGASGDTVIGAWGTGQWFQGIIDDVRVYSHALNESEIQGAMLGTAWPYAMGPKPENGGMITATSGTLQWRAGDSAALHDVYFGESYDAVDAATLDDADLYVGRQATTMLPVGMAGGPAPDGLVPGEFYFWRVDEVNDVEPNSPWKGGVWSFRVQPLIAFDPMPADGVPYVSQDQDLSWEAGMNTLFHTVYFGESFDQVNEAPAGGWMTTDLTYEPGPLEPDKTYYWRVDEFTGMTTQKGEVWSFTTVPEIEVTDPDLVGWWTFDEGVGNTAVDWSGNGNHGALVVDPQRVAGYHGDALAFDGRGDYVNCGTSPSLDIQDEITIACWIKVAAFTRTWETILAKGDNSYRMSRGPGDGDSVHFACNGTTGENLNGTTIVTDDTWHHVAMVYDGVDRIIYLDGVEDARLASTGQIDVSTYDLYIGANAQQGGRYLEGLVDDVRIYSRALTEQEIQVVMRGNPLLAGRPEPSPGAVVSIGDATSLRWLPGDTAASHDVYFGTDKDAVVAADNSSPEFQGNQGGASFSLAGLVEFGGGDYYWRIDEVEADATVHAGNVWKFTVPDYLVVEDFESYDDDIEGGTAVFLTWIDGFENGTGSQAGYLTAVNGTFNETAIVHSGRQALPLVYDNAVAPGIAEVDRTLSPPQDWTREGVTTLVIHFRGDSANTGELYVKINGQKVPYNSDPADIASSQWVPWEIDLASAGVNAASVTSLTIGIEGGTTGTVYIDDIWLTKP